MSIDFYDSVDGDGLFDLLGKIFHAMATLNIARNTTVPDEVEDVLEQFKNISGGDLDFQKALDNLATQTISWQTSSGSLNTTLRQVAENLLIEYVAADADQPDLSLTTALDYVIDQMDENGDYVDASAVTISVSADDDNIGDVQILYTEKRGDGQVQQNALSETLDIKVTSAGTRPVLSIKGDAAQNDRLAHDWPKGSGASLSLTSTHGSSSLLSNGDFEDDTVTDLPDGWVLNAGTVGTSIDITDYEVQTIQIDGTPTGGTYTINWVDRNGHERVTSELDYDATAADVQTALREIPGLENITVSESGTSPNYTHTVTFEGVAGDLNQLSSVNHLTGGISPSVLHRTVTKGTDGALVGKALRLECPNGELTTLYHPLTLSDQTVYFCHVWGRRETEEESTSSSSSSCSTQSGISSSSSSSSQSSSSSSSHSSSSSSSSCSAESTSSQSGVSSSSSSSSGYAEEMRIEILDGIEGQVTEDDEGNVNRLAIDMGALTSTAHSSHWFAFRLPKGTHYPVYLRIQLVDAIAAGEAVYLDEMVVMRGSQLYAGGPYVAAVPGGTQPIKGDKWVMTVSNNRAGVLQEWCHRAFNMAAKGLLLPIGGSGTKIPDSVVG